MVAGDSLSGYHQGDVVIAGAGRSGAMLDVVTAETTACANTSTWAHYTGGW